MVHCMRSRRRLLEALYHLTLEQCHAVYIKYKHTGKKEKQVRRRVHFIFYSGSVFPEP